MATAKLEYVPLEKEGLQPLVGKVLNKIRDQLIVYCIFLNAVDFQVADSFSFGFTVQFTNGCLKSSRKGKKKDGVNFSYYRWKDSSDIRKKQRRTLVCLRDFILAKIP